MKKCDVARIFARFSALNPEPKGELNYCNAYTLLVAVTLSAQATDIGVNKATKALFAEVKNPRQMLDLGIDGLIRHIRTIGLFNSKARNLMKMAEILVTDHDGKVPDTREALESLPGVGRKTANVVLNIAFAQPTMAVDTHIFRLGNRIGMARGKTPLEVEKKLLKIIPAQYMQHAHHWLILHGRYICKARKPECAECPITDWCEYQEKIL